MIRGLFETFVYVADFQRSRRFYEDVLGLTVGWLSEERKSILYWVGPPGSAMLGVVERPVDKVVLQHFSFSIATGGHERSRFLFWSIGNPGA